ncbi:MAG: hypothetical protein Q8P10_00940 [bacterium]|nr:hypothetical protein [bacterium]
MSIEQIAYSPRNPRERLKKINNAKGKIQAMLQAPDGNQWPEHLNLDSSNLSSVEEKLRFLKAGARIADIIPHLETKTLTHLEDSERKLQAQIAETDVSKIRASCERRRSGQAGLPEIVLFKAEELLAEFQQRVLANGSDNQKGNETKPGSKDPSPNLKIPKLARKEKEILDILINNPFKDYTAAELAAAVWKEEDGFTKQQSLKNFYNFLARMRSKFNNCDQIIDVKYSDRPGKKPKPYYHLSSLIQFPAEEIERSEAQTQVLVNKNEEPPILPKAIAPSQCDNTESGEKI